MKHGIIIAGSGRGLYFADLLARTPGLKESCSVKAVVDIRKENHDALRTRLNESGLTETKILTTLPEQIHINQFEIPQFRTHRCPRLCRRLWRHCPAKKQNRY